MAQSSVENAFFQNEKLLHNIFLLCFTDIWLAPADLQWLETHIKCTLLQEVYLSQNPISFDIKTPRSFDVMMIERSLLLLFAVGLDQWSRFRWTILALLNALRAPVSPHMVRWPPTFYNPIDVLYSIRGLKAPPPTFLI